MITGTIGAADASFSARTQSPRPELRFAHSRLIAWNAAISSSVSGRIFCSGERQSWTHRCAGVRIELCLVGACVPVSVALLAMCVLCRPGRSAGCPTASLDLLRRATICGSEL